MAIQTSTASHAEDAKFEGGLRYFFEYRDLGIKTATQGQVDAHVIRAAAGGAFSSQARRHHSAYQPPGIHHRELGHSEDIEMLEVVLPAGLAA